MPNGGGTSTFNGCAALPETHSTFGQLSQIHLMTNNTRNSHNNTATPITTTGNYHSQQDMRKIMNGGKLNSLPRQRLEQESCLTQNHIYSQPIVVGSNGTAGAMQYAAQNNKYNTADRHIRLTQDHFNHNNAKYAKVYGHGAANSDSADSDYLYNNSHYSLPLDHNNLSTKPRSQPDIDNEDEASPARSPPPPTPPPPALPLRNGICNTTGRSSTRSVLSGHNLNNNVATLHNNNLNTNIPNNNSHNHSGKNGIGSSKGGSAANGSIVNNNSNNNQQLNGWTGSLRHQYPH